MQTSKIDFTDKIYADRVELVLDKRCKIVNEDGKMYVVRERKHFPLSMTESLTVLGAKKLSYCIFGHNDKAIKALYKLITHRDAYLKTAEEKKPVWKEGSETKYCIKYGRLITSVSEPCILAFGTEDTRNLFYANFKELIDECKELLG